MSEASGSGTGGGPDAKQKTGHRSDSLLLELGFNDDVEKKGCGTFGYGVLCFAINGLICALAIMLWSSMGWGEETFKFLSEHGSMKVVPFGVSVIIVLIMYLMDLFLPISATLNPSEGCLSSTPGRALLGIAVVLFLVSCLLLQSQFPAVPLLINIVFCPVSAVVVRALSKIQEVTDQHSRVVVEQGNVELQMKLLKKIVGSERDVICFYKGAFGAFLLVSLACIVAWVIWVLALADHGVQTNMSGLSAREKDEVWILWVAPLVVGISNFVFSLFLLLRVRMQQTYEGTDSAKSHLISHVITLSKEISKHRATMMQAKFDSALLQETQGLEDRLKDAMTEFEHRDTQSIKRISELVKVVVCIFVVLIGCIYVAAQLLYADSKIATLVLGVLATFFITFVVFTYLSFRRIVRAMGKWLTQLPAFAFCKACLSNGWFRAFVLGPVLPVIPFVLVLSVVNQYVRKCRNVYPRLKEDEAKAAAGAASGDEGPELVIEVQVKDPEKLLLTPRVHASLEQVRSWDWPSLFFRLYILCGAFVCYNITPPLLNVLLALMRNVLKSWPFPVIVVTTFLLGVAAFLCPFVPGMTVYLFGGLVISGTCPPIDSDQGFWLGSVINIIMCWFLKLTACAVEQKFIGERLGTSRWVRQQVGVHSTFIRCIESILKQPGWTVGKVAILCGGPDWPTSVLAGVLRLSLIQCEIGTIPIIGFIVPCALSGSLYLKMDDEDAIWSRAAAMMIVVSVAVNLLLWAMAAWSAQVELDKNRYELERKREDHLDLKWLDYRLEKVNEATQVPWSDVPVVCKVLYTSGVLLQVLVCHAMWWGYNKLISNFAVSDDINRLSWYSGTLYHADRIAPGETIPLFSLAAYMLFVLYLVTIVFFIVYSRWYKIHTSESRKAAFIKMDAEEEEWKRVWLEAMRKEQADHERELAELAAAQEKQAAERAQEATSLFKSMDALSVISIEPVAIGAGGVGPQAPVAPLSVDDPVAAPPEEVVISAGGSNSPGRPKSSGGYPERQTEILTPVTLPMAASKELQECADPADRMLWGCCQSDL